MGVAISQLGRHGDPHGAASPWIKRLDLDDHQRSRADRPGLLPGLRREAGRRPEGPARDRAERHPQRVPSPARLARRARARAAHDHGRDGLLRGERSEVEHDLDLRLPHPRSGLHGCPRAGVHPRQRDGIRPARRRGGHRHRRLCAAVVVLLRQPPRLLRGDRQVPCRAPHLGAQDARRVRSQGPAVVDAALPHADGRRLADRAATPRTTSCVPRSRRWRRCSAVPSRCTPTRWTRRCRSRPRRR